MKRSEFKQEFLKLIYSEVENFNLAEKVNMVKGFLFELEKEVEYEVSNKGKPWTDEELQLVLSMSPTKENCLRLAKAFKRGYGSIEQIYRWAATSDRDIELKGRTNDKFVQQVKRIAKEVGWRV